MAGVERRIERLEEELQREEQLDGTHRWFAVGDGLAGPIQQLTDDELLAFERLLQRVVRGEATPVLVTSVREDGRPVLRAHLSPAEVEQLAHQVKEEEGQPPSDAAAGAKLTRTV